jgi:hypothetical protein
VWDFGITKNGELRFEGGGNSVKSKSGTVSVGEWTHVAVVFSDEEVTFYKNGAKVKDDDLDKSLTSKAAPISIGRGALSTDGSRRFDGIIDEVTVFAKALDKPDIVKLRDANDHACLCASTGSFIATKRGDCDDSAAAVNPTNTEICDGKDNNCNLIPDDLAYEACKPAGATTACSEGSQACVEGTKTCVGKPFVHLALNENTGSLLHNSTTEGRGGHGIGVSWTTGRFGKGVDMGQGSAITVRGPSNFDSAGGLAFWVKPGFDPTTKDVVLAARTAAVGDSSGSTGLVIRIKNKKLEVRAKSGGQIRVSAGTFVPQGKWTHVGVSWIDAAGNKEIVGLFINGKRVSSKALDIGTQAEPYVMFGPGKNQSSVGVYDSLVVYDFGPTTSVFRTLATTGVPPVQDTREFCDGGDNDCDGKIDESSDPYSNGSAVAGQYCETGDGDNCTDGVWKCSGPISMAMACDDGPTGYFEFEEAGSVAFDQGGDVAHAELVNTTQITGKSGKGVRVAGASSFIRHSFSGLDLHRGAIAFWMRPNFNPASLTSSKGIFLAGRDGNYADQLGVRFVAGGKLRVQLGTDRHKTVPLIGRLSLKSVTSRSIWGVPVVMRLMVISTATRSIAAPSAPLKSRR